MILFLMSRQKYLAGKSRSHGLSISYYEIEFCTCVPNANSSAHTQSLMFPEKPGLTFNCPWEKRRKLIQWVWKTESWHSKKKQEAEKRWMTGWWVSDIFVEFMHVVYFLGVISKLNIRYTWRIPGYIDVLLSVPSYWDAHGHTNTTRNNIKRGLLRLQGQLFRIMTIRASLFLRLMPHNPVFNYMVTGFLIFFLL